MDVSQELIKSANWWFSLSWKGLLASAMLAALGAVGTGAFLYVQFWSGNVRDRYAEARASEQGLQISQANKDTAAAHVRIRELDLSVAQANEKAAEATRQSEQDRLARLTLERQVAPRRIDAAQRATIAAIVAGHACEFHVMWPPDPETIPFGRQIAEAFAAAGCRVIVAGGANHIMPTPFGLNIRPKGTIVEAALHAAGIAVMASDWPPPRTDWKGLPGSIPHGAISLVVGLRPSAD